ncbi:hypothetical protein Pst134EB_025223 [Puccinia striiformis f. sp. tritici]|nr:hypothetical protein Pst134EB_025223 [Puccinia striiformis f. sp. tritici]
MLTATVNCIKNCIKLIRNDPNTAANHIDNLSLGSMSRLGKLDLIKHKIKIELNNHGSLLEDWNSNIAWLWRQCQPQRVDHFFNSGILSWTGTEAGV